MKYILLVCVWQRKVDYSLYISYMERNRGELARPPTVRFNIGAEDSGFFNKNRKPDNAFLNTTTKGSSLANF